MKQCYYLSCILVMPDPPPYEHCWHFWVVVFCNCPVNHSNVFDLRNFASAPRFNRFLFWNIYNWGHEFEGRHIWVGQKKKNGYCNMNCNEHELNTWSIKIANASMCGQCARRHFSIKRPGVNALLCSCLIGNWSLCTFCANRTYYCDCTQTVLHSCTNGQFFGNCQAVRLSVQTCTNHFKKTSSACHHASFQ